MSSPTNLDITVRTITGKEIKIVIEPQYTILQINELIEADSGIPPEQQWLITSGKRIDKDKTLTAEACNIEDGATLSLVLTLRGGASSDLPISTKEQPLRLHPTSNNTTLHVTVCTPTGQDIEISIEPDFTLLEVKELIEVYSGIPPYQQWLEIGGKPIDNDPKFIVRYYGLKDGATLNLIHLTYMIEVKARKPIGEEIKLVVDCRWAIQRLKQLIEDVSGARSCDQRLIYGGKQMVDEKTIAQYEIQPGSTLHLIMALRGPPRK